MSTNIFRVGNKLHKMFTKSGKDSKVNIKAGLSPTKTLYLWEKRTLKKIELFTME